MFLHRLQPLQITATWDQIVACVKASVPECSDPAVLANVMNAVVSNRLQAWAIVRRGKAGDRLQFVGMGLTKVSQDEWTKRRVLFLYSLHAFEGVTLGEWKRLAGQLEAVAREWGCQSVEANTDKVMVEKLAAVLGFSRVSILRKDV